VIHPRTFSLLIPEGARQHAAGWLTGAILLGMSSHDVYAEPERGRTLTVVLLALLILTVIGALFGFVLGRRDKSDTAGPATGQSSKPSMTTTTPGVKREECPSFIQEGAVKQKSSVSGPLTLELWIRTDNHEVWICREADGSGLWYQGHDKKKAFYPDEIPKQGDNGLLVGTGVTNAGLNKYIAVTNGTTRTVSTERLVVSGQIDEPVKESHVPK
jgi:hypothetical protein